MINNVRSTVLSIINKEDRGWITPEEFNLFCAMAQLEVFEDYFYEYNKWLNFQNKRLTNSEYSDIPKNIREKIDRFSDNYSLPYDNVDYLFIVPDEIYRIEALIYSGAEIDEVSKRDLINLENANLNPPTEEYPVYTRFNNNIKVLPATINSTIKCYALRKPLTPKWTYIEVSENPLFNPSADDYQDLEIHPSDEPSIIVKILSYVGISLREADVAQFMEAKEIKQTQKENA